MEYVNIKGISRPVSRLFVGSAWISEENADEAMKIYDRFFELGGNIIDTARFYGKGRLVAGAERVVGDWVRRSGIPRDEILIQNKCCHPFITKDGVSHTERWRVSPVLITEDLIYSLDDMGLDYFDNYQLHRDDESIPVGELLDVLEEHRRAGLIRAYGLSNWKTERVAAAMDYCRKKGYQGPSTSNPAYSLAAVKYVRWKGCVFADDAFAAWHRGKDITFVAWSAQAAGFFAGVFSDSFCPDHAKEAFFNEENFEKLRRAEILAEKYGVTATNIALAYVFSQDFPICAIVGPQTVKQLESCVFAEGLRLTSEDVRFLRLE